MQALMAATAGGPASSEQGKGATRRPRGYRCLADAVQAAKDGDKIALLAGVHPTGGTTDMGILVNKRVLIYGHGGAEQVLLLQA
jgi:hypothetical protein